MFSGLAALMAGIQAKKTSVFDDPEDDVWPGSGRLDPMVIWIIQFYRLTLPAQRKKMNNSIICNSSVVWRWRMLVRL